MADSNTDAQNLNSLIDSRIQKALGLNANAPYNSNTNFVGVVDSVNSDQTINLHTIGSSVILNNFPNRSCTDIEPGDLVSVENSGSGNDCVVRWKLGKSANRIGYARCYIAPDSGLVCINTAKTLKVVVNNEECFSLYTGDGTGSNWTLAGSFTTNGLEASRLSTVGSAVFLIAGNIGPNGNFLGAQVMHGGTGDSNELLGVGYLTSPAMGLSMTHKGIRWAQVLDDDTLVGANIDQSNPTYTWYNGTDAGMVVNATTTMRSNPTQFSIYTDFYCSKTKSCIQTTQDYGDRALYTVEAPDNRFVDYGRGTLVNGECMITIDPIFAQCLSDKSNFPYDVMLTKYGQGDIWVDYDSIAGDSFTVKGTADISFCYEVIGHRRGFEDVRFKEMEKIK